jgi:hypothetical protein
VILAGKVVFASEVVGAGRDLGPKTALFRRHEALIDSIEWLSADDKRKTFEGNPRKVYSRYKY